nr:ribonuclease H-like domain-containing protein [Tanacetum cinerariifolium]
MLEDLEQIYEDDIVEMDLKWQLGLLSMRAKWFFQKTSKKITINESDTAGYDKAKVECFNCHKMGHFTRECRVPRNQENRTRNQETTRRIVNVEDISYKAMEIYPISLTSRSLIEGMLHLGDELKVLADESHVLLKVARKNNMYSVDMNNIVPKKDLTCLIEKAKNDESMLWHRTLGHINFKNINKLVKDNLVR